MKKFIICRGCPGSGKSTWAKQERATYLHNNVQCEICSTDDFFIGPDGIYKFNKYLLGVNHNKCFEKFVALCNESCEVIILDNTNIKKDDYKRYLEVARLHGYDIHEQCFLDTPVEECIARNTHNVPPETIRRMHESLERNFWKNDL